LRSVKNLQSFENILSAFAERKNNVIVEHVAPDKGPLVAPVRLAVRAPDLVFTLKNILRKQ